MFSWLANAWRVPELRHRVLFTAMILAFYRLGSWIPAPGVNADAISSYFSGRGGTILGLLSLFSGGALSRFSIFALGIMPYITASIILQLLRSSAVAGEGEGGRVRQVQPVHATRRSAWRARLGYSYLFRRQGIGGRAPAASSDRQSPRRAVLLMWFGSRSRGRRQRHLALIFASITSRARRSGVDRRRPHHGSSSCWRSG